MSQQSESATTNRLQTQCHASSFWFRPLVLLLVAVICGWKACGLGFFNDDLMLFWILGDAPQPEVLLTGRLSTYFLWWIIYDASHLAHSGVIHLLIIGLHLLMANELLHLCRVLGLSEPFAAVAVLVFALFPAPYEAYYWIPGLIYPLAGWLVLLALRLFRLHVLRRSYLALAGAGICFFLACSTVELAWVCCACFVLLQLHLQRIVGKPLMIQWVRLWPSFALVGVAAAAVALYLFLNRQADDRLGGSGGISGLAQFASNVLTMLRSTITWPKRTMQGLLDGAMADFWVHQDVQFWIFLTVVVLLGTAWVAGATRSAPQTERSPMDWCWLGLVAAVGLIFLFGTGLTLATVIPHFRSRIYYFCAIGIGLLLATGLEVAHRTLRNEQSAAGLVRASAYALAFYLAVVAPVHYFIQDAFARAWHSQQQLYRFARESLSDVSQDARFLFIGPPNLTSTHLVLYQLNELRDLDSALSLEWGLKRPHRISAANVHLTVAAKEDGSGMTLRLNRPRGQSEGEIDLAGKDMVHGVVLFGLEGERPVVYDKLRLYDVRSRTSVEYDLAASRSAKGPFVTLVVRY